MEILALRRLYAHNLIDNLKNECAGLAARYAQSPAVAKWFTSILRNWLNNVGATMNLSAVSVPQSSGSQ